MEVVYDETQVLEDCAKELEKVKHIFIDFHPSINKNNQSLSQILFILDS